MKRILMASSWVALAGIALAMVPPGLVNFQGILRDASGSPENGPFDMVFRFYDASLGGNEILIDEHLAAGTGAVSVADGLFDVQLGGGTVSDGAATLPNDPYASLGEVFRDFTEVWVQIEVDGGGGFEILSPRARVLSAAYSLNTDNFDGRDSSFFLDASSTTQQKTGLLIASGGVDFGGGASDDLTSSDVTALTDGGSADGLHTHTNVGNSSTLDGLDSSAFLRSNASDQYTSGLLTFSPGTELDHDGVLDVLGGTLQMGSSVSKSGTGLVANFNADLLDGLNGAQFLRSETSDIFSGAQLTFAPGAQLGIDSGTASDPGIGFSSDSKSGIYQAAVDTLSITTGGNEAVRFQLNGDATVTGDVIANGYQLFLGPLESVSFSNANSRFELSDALQTGSNIVAGAAGVVNFNAFGFTDSESGAMVDKGDVYVGNDLEVHGVTLLSGTLFMDGDLAPVDGDQIIFFADGGNKTGQSFFWDDSASQFVLSEDLWLSGGDLFLGPEHSIRSDVGFDDLVLRRDDNANSSGDWFRVFEDSTIEQMRIESGDEAAAKFDGVVNANGLDYAEAFRVEDATLEAGDVVVHLLGEPGAIARSTMPYAPHIAGVISERPGFVTGDSFNAEEAADPELTEARRQAMLADDYELARQLTGQLIALKEQQIRPVALAGRVPVKVDGSYGEIQPGDPLTSSPTPGHAMVMGHSGPSIGIALEAWSDSGTGKVLAFINPGLHAPSGSIEAAHEAQAELSEELDQRTPDPNTGVQAMNGNLQVVLDQDANDRSRFSVFRDGEAGELGAEVFRVDEEGNVYASGAFRPTAMDLAEYFPVSEAAEPGDVLVADRDNPGAYVLARQAADPAVVGIVSSEPGVLLGSSLSRIADVEPDLSALLAEARRLGDEELEADVWAQLETRFDEAHAPVALSGTVPCKVDAGFGEIRVGDLLTTSPTPGHAMRADDAAPGTILGKALESLEAGTGVVRVLVMLR